MRRRIGVAAIICVLAGMIFLLLLGTRHALNEPLRPDSSKTPAQPKLTNKIANPAASAAVAKIILPSPVSPGDNKSAYPVLPSTGSTSISITPELTNLPPEAVMENMRTVFRSYQSMFGGNPVGTNPEITQALDGGNPRQTHFINEENGMRINRQGELIDPWGTAYFFHQLSGTEMEIHSAGPDKAMWTSDDLVIR